MHRSTESTKPVLLLGNYRLRHTIGVGSFGKVKAAEHVVTGHKVAVKILDRRKIRTLRMDAKIKREIQILKLLRHPHIIKLYEVIETPTHIFLVMEYVSGGELFDYIASRGRLSEDIGRAFMQQIISGVTYCHQHMVVHRDLKPENLLLDSQSNVKIADFGLSNLMIDGDFLKTSCGSPNYAAPEVISGEMYAGPEVDVWSCGIILYALLCARLPFDDPHIPTLFQKIRQGRVAYPPYLSNACVDLISKMLVVDPLKRITVAEIWEHEWFQKNLPSYLETSPEELVCSYVKPEDLDQEVLYELMEKFKVTKEEAMRQLSQGEKSEEPVNKFVVAYHLIYDNIHRAFARSLSARRSQKLAALSCSPPISLRDELPFDVVVPENDKSSKAAISPRRDRAGSFAFNRKVWSLGVNTDKPPRETMNDVTRALRNIHFEWKVVAPYCLRCRSIFRDEELLVKFQVQLYKLRTKRYLLDFKMLNGEVFGFFDICTKLVSELQNPTSHSSGSPVRLLDERKPYKS